MVIEDFARNIIFSSLATAGQPMLPGFLLLKIKGLRIPASECQNLRESATNLADCPSYRSQRVQINLASNSKSTLRGIEMTLATVAYRISTDVSFAALLQKNAEETLQKAGIALSNDEKSALLKLLSLPGQIIDAGNVMLTAEPWVM